MRGNTYTFNSDNQITNSGFSYDGEGNPTTYGGTSLTFDAEDRHDRLRLGHERRLRRFRVRPGLG
jgi:hypothetical protein